MSQRSVDGYRQAEFLLTSCQRYNLLHSFFLLPDITKSQLKFAVSYKNKKKILIPKIDQFKLNCLYSLSSTLTIKKNVQCFDVLLIHVEDKVYVVMSLLAKRFLTPAIHLTVYTEGCDSTAIIRSLVMVNRTDRLRYVAVSDSLEIF